MSYIRHLLVLASLAWAAFPAIALSASPLTQEQIAQNIIGKTLNAKRMGMAVRILYKPDGTVSTKFAIMSGAGTWKYNGNGICMDLTSGPRREKACVTFEHLGGKKFRNSKGIVFTVQDQ